MPRRKHLITCLEFQCSELPYLGGLCSEHHQARSGEREAKDRALSALSGTGPLPEAAGRRADQLREELKWLQARWNLACDTLIHGRSCKWIPLEEAEHAVSWCISFAKELFTALELLEVGESVPASLDGTRHWVVDRFENLQASLVSNGLLRTEGSS